MSEGFPTTETGYTDQLRAMRKTAWGKLYTSYGPGIRDVFRRAGVRADHLDDEVMNAVYLIPVKVASSQKIERFGAWLRGVLRNMAMDYHRMESRQSHERPQQGVDAQELLASIPEFEPTDEIEQLSRNEALMGQLLENLKRRLTPKRFQILAVILEGRRQREAASEVGLVESTVSNILKDKIHPIIKEEVNRLLEDQ